MKTMVRRAALAAAGFALACFNLAQVRAAVIAGPVVNPANGHRYSLLSQGGWTAAEAEAVSLGGHLATVNDAAENAFLYTTFARFGGVDRNLWIGLFDADPAVNSTSRAARRGEFAWASGEPVTYAAWSPVEPNNPASGDAARPEFYGHVWNPSDPNRGTWNNYYDLDAEFGVGLFGVVEVVPEPAGATAVSVALGAGLLCRRRPVR